MTQRHPTQNEALMMITTNTLNRLPIFKNNAYAHEAIETLYRVQELHPFLLHGFVIMPDHCHLLMFVPEPESISKIMNVYKAGMTFNLGIPKLWQPRFFNRIVNNAYAVLNYIHMNPVKTKFVEKPEDYPWSSASGKWDVTELEYY